MCIMKGGAAGTGICESCAYDEYGAKEPWNARSAKIGRILISKGAEKGDKAGGKLSGEHR